MDGPQRASLPGFGGNARRGERRNLRMVPARATEQHLSPRRDYADEVDGADRACRVGVHRCDIGDLDKMSGKQFIWGSALVIKS